MKTEGCGGYSLSRLAAQYQAIGQTPHNEGILPKALDEGSSLDYYGILRESKSRGIPP